MLETYITPLLMSYVDKYIKNLKPSDFSLSIWGGDVVLYNLELRLDVLEKELQLPITFLSGKIHKLQIHVPWTKLLSEPVEITINTIECVIQLKDPSFKQQKDTSSHLTVSEVKKELDKKNFHDRGEPPPAGYIQSLVNKVANNITICVHNVILKYVEDDIVLSLNVKSAETFSVNSDWKKAFVDVTAPEYVLHKVCNISNLTICLDKKGTSGDIEMYQDPLLFKCGLSCRVTINYDAHLRPKGIKLNVYCECFDLSLTNEQIPLFVRLLKLCLSVYYGTLDLPGCEYKPHPAARMIEENSYSHSRKSSVSSIDQRTESPDVTTASTVDTAAQEDWLNWMWSFIPDATVEETAEEHKLIAPDVQINIGLYISQVSFTVKLTHKISESTFFGAQRFQFRPLLSCEMSGVAVEIVIKGEEFFDAQVGVTSIMCWTIGDCACHHGNDLDIRSIEEEDDIDEKEEEFLTICAPEQSPSEPQGFLIGSLFYDNQHTSLVLPELTFEADSFIEQHSEAYALKRYGAFFFDYLYTMEIEPEKEDRSVEGEAVGLDYLGNIRLVREVSHKRIILGPTHLQCTTGLLHRLTKIYEFTSDEAPERSMKDAPFYDEFVEKQLLAGNIPSRYFTVTMVSVKVTIPPSDHAEMTLVVQPTGRSPDSVSSLQSIHESGKPDSYGMGPSLVISLERMEIQKNNPMYPTELCKLIIANADLPAGRAMLHHAFNNIVIEIFNTQVLLSHNVTGSADIVIMPRTSMILSVKDCILPDNWGDDTIKRVEAHLELPLLAVDFTKPQLLLVYHLMTSWLATLSQKKSVPVIPKSLITKVFDKEVHSCSEPSSLHLNLTNADIQCCTTSHIMSASISVGSINLTLQTTNKDGQAISTPLVQGPCNTGDVYNGALFTSGISKERKFDVLGPVISFSIQMPLKLDETYGTSNAVGILPSVNNTCNAFLLHVKGIAICLDPLLYSWIDSQFIQSASSSSVKAERERKKRAPSLTRTSSIGTPRKKSFARVYGPTTPQKEKKSPGDRSSSKDADSSENQGYTVETWLFDKLPLITTFAVQVDLQSVVLFTPENHVSYDPQAHSIPQNFVLQRQQAKDTSDFPSVLVLCLPALELYSSNHSKVSYRPKLPVQLNRHNSKDPSKRDTLPWTLNASNLSMYTIHDTIHHSNITEAVYYMISPVSCTAVLASAQTSSVTLPGTSPLHHSVQRGHKGGGESNKFPTLGFCVHTDFTPVVVSSSRKQIALLANITESLLHTVIPSSPPPSSAVDINATPTTPAKTAVPTLQRTVSMTSSSALEQPEKDIECCSESSSSYTDINQAEQGVRLSLWLQWTLPRLVIKLFGDVPNDKLPICITADLEDLTAFVDYQDTHLQMQYKVGGFGVTNAVKRSDNVWHPGLYGGILFSCKDILSYKTSPLIASPRLPLTGNTNDGPISNPHGFLTITYNCLNLHLKRRESEKPRSDFVPNEYYQLQHEVRVTVQPFDLILWTPAIVAAIDVFDTRLIDKFKFLSQGSVGNEPKETTDKEDTDNTMMTTSLLPLLFMNMRDIRLFLPCSDLMLGNTDNTTISEDLIVVHLSKVSTIPHPDNPIGRSVLSKHLYEQYVGFGRSSRRALGYDLHEVQYQTDLKGFGIWVAKWSELCGNLTQENQSNSLMDQNPALEWNTRLWRSAKEINVSQLLSETDVKVILAPAVAMEMSVPNSKVTKSLPVCGWSVEMNIVTDIDCYLNKAQIVLLQLLVAVNIEVVSKCELLLSLSQSNATSYNVKTPTCHSERTDSGLGSSRPDSSKKHQTLPFEAFFAARKLSIKLYTRHISYRPKSLHSSPLHSREGSPGRSLSLASKPVLMIDIVEPAVIFKDHMQGPGFQLWCYDVTVMSSEPQQGWVHKSLPEACDFTKKCFTTKAGVPNHNTGVKPSLLTAGARRMDDGTVNTFIDIGRQIQINFSLNMMSELNQLFGDIVIQSGSSSTAKDTPFSASTALCQIDVKTRGVSLELSMSTRNEESQKLIVAMAELGSYITMKYGEKGTFPRINANLESEGLEVSFVIGGQRYYFIRPFNLKCDVEMASSQSSLAQLSKSMPPICSHIDIGLLQIDFGQQHLRFITTASKVLQDFASHSTNEKGTIDPLDYTNKQTRGEKSKESTSKKGHSDSVREDVSLDANSLSTYEKDTRNILECEVQLTKTKESKENETREDLGVREDAALDFEIVGEEKPLRGCNDVPQDPDVFKSFDDLRTGPFKYVTLSGDVGLHHPDPYEIIFTSDTRDKPPSMIWRYPEPRALVTVEVLPLPFTSPILVNTLNMGDELRVPCVLAYWDNLQQSYVVYKEFYISEVSSCNILLPDPLTADPSTVILSEEWQMIIDASIDVEYSDDYSVHDDDGGSSYSSPFRSLISPTSLAASVKVNSVYSPLLIPVVSAQFSVSMLDIKLLNHTIGTTQVLPKYLEGFTLDQSVPTEQEFFHLAIEGISGVTKHISGCRAATLCNVELNCYCEVMDFDDLTYKTFISPFDFNVTANLFHKNITETSSEQEVWLQSNVVVGDIDSVISQSTVHTLSVAATSWTRPLGDLPDETVLFNHYIICNDTNEDIRLGQVDTDEAILLPSCCVLPYSWRITRDVKRQSKMHVCFESEGDWRWSEPFDTDTIGACTRVIHHKLHSASIVMQVLPLSGVQKQVIFRGCLQITSRLSVKVDLQILKNPSLDSVTAEKSTLQVHEDITLLPDTTLPSYVVSHAGLVGIRIRIPGMSMWSEPLPLDQVYSGAAKHLIIKLLGVKTFQTFYLWYSMEKTVYDQSQVTVSPLFVMRSHLPDPVLMNVFTAKTNTTCAIEVQGRGQQEQLLVFQPNAWHHLTFQVNSQGGTSQPSVPLNSTLIDLVNKVSPGECDDGGVPLDTLWPYCGGLDQRQGVPIQTSKAPVVRHVVSSKATEQPVNTENKELSEEKACVPFPDIELQCRVIKKWNGLSTLLVDVIPWCLMVNRTMTSLYVRDRETKMEIELESSQTIAPYKFKGLVQLGLYIADSTTITWSKPITLDANTKPNQSTSTTDQNTETNQPRHVTISIVHVTKTDQPMAVLITMTSQLRHGVLVVSLQEKYSLVNSTGSPLIALTALAAQGKKVSHDVLSVPRGVSLLPGNSDINVPVSLWFIPSSSSVVLDKEGVATVDDTLTVIYVSHDHEEQTNPDSIAWSSAYVLNPNVSRHALSLPDGNTSIPLVITWKEVSGVTYIVIAVDPLPRFVIHNDCPFTLQFGQAAPPQSPSYQKGSNEKLVVMEQMLPPYEIPEVPAHGMMHYELPVMREWFQKVNLAQQLPEVHIQAMYNVTVSEISEDSEAAITCGQSTEVPQGWTHGFDINKYGHFVVNLPGRGRVIVFVSKIRLRTVIRVKPYDEETTLVPPRKERPVTTQVVKFNFIVSKIDMCIVDARTSTGVPVELLRAHLNGISVSHEPFSGDPVCEFSLKLNAVQLDNQLDGYEFPVVVITDDNRAKPRSDRRQPGSYTTTSKPFLMIQVKYEPATDSSSVFIRSVVVGIEPLTAFLEDTLVYRLLNSAESFLPPLHASNSTPNPPDPPETVMCVVNSLLQPLVIGEFTIQPITIHLTLHASIKLFVAMDDTPLNLSSLQIRPVFADGSSFARNVLYHYVTAVLFKVGWVVGSLDILGSPAGFLRNVSQGFADFFYFPYDGLTRGPGAFVSGMSHGVSSFVRHISTGALTSVTNLASSISRNLDKLSMDEGHIRLQEEQRSRRPTRLVTGITHGLGGFGLSLLGAVAGVVDQPIQGIQRANDVRQAATGVLTGVGKGLVGVVTKPLGGAMELVSQAGQGILRGTGLSHVPCRVHSVEEKMELVSSNSHLKYSWKMLHFKTSQDLLMSTDVTVVTTSGHEYAGALLLTNSTLYIANLAVDAVQQTLQIQDTELQKHDNDNRMITVTSVISHNFPDIVSDSLPTGDRERLEQFLRDAQAYARESHSDGNGEESPAGPVFTSKFALMVDPIVRDAVLSLFKNLKYNLMIDAVQIQ